MHKKIIFSALVTFVLPTVVLGAQIQGDVVSEAFGLNMHAHQRIPQEYQSAMMQTASENGVEWAREEFIWQHIEPEDNAYDWSAYDAVVDQYEEQSIHVLGLLTYSTTWSSTQPDSSEYEFYPPDMDAWRDYVGQVSARYAGRIDDWEIWNEPNLESFWHSDPQTYAQLLQVAAEEIQANNPNAHIVFGGVSGSDDAFLNAVYAALEDPSIVDVVAFHPYREINGDFLYGPEDTQQGLNTLRADIVKMKVVLQRYNQLDTPLWLTEIGWPTSETGVTEAAQANYLMRMYMTALSIPGVQKVFWYSFVDDPQQFGLLKEDYEPKESLAAYHFMQQRLNTKRFTEETMLGAHTIDDFTKSQGWIFGTGECSEGFVDDALQSRMRVTVQFTKKQNCYAPIYLYQQLPHKTRAVQFVIRGNNPNALVRMRITDSSGETFQYDIGSIPDQQLIYTVQLSAFAASWGGNADGVLDQPLTFDSFILNNRNNKKSEGTIWFDSLSSSAVGNTFLYTYSNDMQTVHALWKSRGSKKMLLTFPEAKQLRVHALNKKPALFTGHSDQFRVRANKRIRFLRERQ